MLSIFLLLLVYSSAVKHPVDSYLSEVKIQTMNLRASNSCKIDDFKNTPLTSCIASENIIRIGDANTTVAIVHGDTMILDNEWFKAMVMITCSICPLEIMYLVY